MPTPIYTLGRAKAALDNPASKPTAATNMHLDVFILLPFLSLCSAVFFTDSDALDRPFIANHNKKNHTIAVIKRDGSTQ